MKKLTSLALAVVSTMLLATGATRAAGKFDVLVQADTPSASGATAPIPAPPCIILDEGN